ncbi:hypothetical protein ABEI22_14225 [Erwinia billingiae]|uniref:hypothetical protein n=1 Tax=Erwinia billingiae TaxID=182337 RepID=UPI0012FEC317|nr:hypothetical protein [Erwinia billingiae]
MKIYTALICMVVSLLGWSNLSHADSTVVFTGSKYTAKITEHCSEGNVSCEDVTAYSKSNKTGEGIHLKGETVNVNCPESCNFRGYSFKNGAYTYSFTTNDFEKWNLNIFKNDKAIAGDVGTLQ